MWGLCDRRVYVRCTWYSLDQSKRRSNNEIVLLFFLKQCVFKPLVACLRSNTLKDVVLVFMFMIVSSSDMLNDELKRRMSSSQSGLTPKAERKGNCFGDSQRPLEHTKQY